MKKFSLILTSMLGICALSACTENAPTDAEATQALRSYKDPFFSMLSKKLGSSENSYPEAVVIVKYCNKETSVSGFLCNIDWHQGNNIWNRDRLVGFSRDKNKIWSISQW